MKFLFAPVVCVCVLGESGCLSPDVFHEWDKESVAGFGCSQIHRLKGFSTRIPGSQRGEEIGEWWGGVGLGEGRSRGGHGGGSSRSQATLLGVSVSEVLERRETQNVSHINQMPRVWVRSGTCFIYLPE